jgi:Ca2+-binding EF-hand superfamily protein
MWRVAVLVGALTVVPSFAAAQQPCTTDARQVIEQVYRQVLERSMDAGASVWLDRLNNRTTVRFCANGEQPGQQSSIAPGNANGAGMRFRRMDTNNDGVIARTEWRGNPRTFNTYDWNNDGRLSGDEVSVIAQRRGNRNGQDDEIASDDRFDYLDINGNGYIDTNEWDGGQYAFDRLDTNDDRRLTRGEFNTANNGNANNFAAVDMNGDGRIRLDEWPWSHTSFDRQDANGDGVISRGEYRGAPPTARP